MWMIPRPPCFSPILCRSVDINGRRCWRRRTSHSIQSKWTVTGACVCNREGLKAPYHILQKEASRKTHFKKRWFLPFLFVLRSVGITLGQIYSCCIICTHFSKASSSFQCPVQRRGCAYKTWCGAHSSKTEEGDWSDLLIVGGGGRIRTRGLQSPMSKREQSWRFSYTPPTICTYYVLSAMVLHLN